MYSRSFSLNKPFVKYFFLIIGIAAMGGGGYFYFKTNKFLDSAATTKGDVIDIVKETKYRNSTNSSRRKHRSSSSRRKTYYYPVVSFKTENGETIEFKSNSGSNPAKYEVGDKIEVMYNQKNPKDAKVNSFFSVWGITVILGGAGFLFFAIGLLSIIFKKNVLRNMPSGMRM